MKEKVALNRHLLLSHRHDRRKSALKPRPTATRYRLNPLANSYRYPPDQSMILALRLFSACRRAENGDPGLSKPAIPIGGAARLFKAIPAAVKILAPGYLRREGRVLSSLPIGSVKVIKLEKEIYYE